MPCRNDRYGTKATNPSCQLRVSRDYQALRNALLAGGVAMSALDTLVNSNPTDLRKDSVVADTQRYDLDEYGQKPAATSNLPQRERIAPSYPPSGRVVSNGNDRPQDAMSWRRVSDFASIPDDSGYDIEGENDVDDHNAPSAPLGSGESLRRVCQPDVNSVLLVTHLRSYFAVCAIGKCAAFRVPRGRSLGPVLRRS